MSSFFDKLGDGMDKLSEGFEKLATKADRAKESIAFAVNPDHRHDEAHEKAEDEERAAIAAGHRFQSFADVKSGNQVKWYICGHDYFHAVSEIIANAKECIYISDWWLSPELYLRRPPALHEDYRLDRLLKRKAEEGVKVFVIIYKEVTQTMTMSSAHSKHFLEDLHDNVKVFRHPDHLGGEVVLYWSHHRKHVVLDNKIATIGGLDLCFGRWDTTSAPLSDVHPTDFARTLFAGQDFNNARIQDFQEVDKWASNTVSRRDAPRMPWEDVHTMLVGPAVLDIAQDFTERWNFIRDLKYKHDRGYPMLAFPHQLTGDEDPTPAIARHPHLHRFAEGLHFTGHRRHAEEEQHTGNMRVQVLRSSSDWSHGILTEHSIQNAYIEMIREARHYVYIENQFFITATNSNEPVIKNTIGQAIVERVLSAAHNNEKFKLVVVIPAIPGFAGDLDGNSGVLAILGAQYRSISRGDKSIFEVLRKEGVDPHQFIEFYNLRGYDRINADSQRLDRMAQNSGVTFEQAQAALCRVYLGRDALPAELEKNKTVKFVVPREGGEKVALDDSAEAKKNPAVEFPLPQSYDEAWEIIRRFEAADEVREHIADSVAHHAMAGQRSLFDEVWEGDEASERNAYVSEQVYPHTKLLIADDTRVLIGSANINDRSQLGDRDSEIAIVIEDNDMIESRMNGKRFLASRFASSLRRQLYKNHLGLAPPQFCPPVSEEPVTAAMRPVTFQSREDHFADELQSREDQLVMDPLSPETEALLRDTAAKNTQCFESVFHCVPTNKVKTWEEYKAHVPQAPIKPGHVAKTDMPVEYIKQQLDQVRGHIVSMPLDFLSSGAAGPLLLLAAHIKPDHSSWRTLLPHHHKERLLALDAEVNPVTLTIYT
ncbi:hypothetical protein JCM10207_005173 [Rhodosporidiobolus poonsookiae]